MTGTASPKLIKMNGLGNEIVVLDLRGRKARIGAEAARRIAEAPRTRFDQMMVLHDPRMPGTEAYVRIHNTDGSEAEACGNGMRCVGWQVARAVGSAGRGPKASTAHVGVCSAVCRPRSAARWSAAAAREAR